MLRNVCTLEASVHANLCWMVFGFDSANRMANWPLYLAAVHLSNIVGRTTRAADQDATLNVNIRFLTSSFFVSCFMSSH